MNEDLLKKFEKTNKLFDKEFIYSLYAKVSQDIQSGIKDEGVWVKAYSESGGNLEKQKAKYLDLMVEKIILTYESQKEIKEEKERIREKGRKISEEKRKKRIKTYEIRKKEEERQKRAIEYWQEEKRRKLHKKEAKKQRKERRKNSIYFLGIHKGTWIILLVIVLLLIGLFIRYIQNLN